MSTAEILSLISTISFVIAAISFVVAVFFWFNFKIPAVIGDLSGRTAKKSIAQMRANNERVGGRGYRPSSTNARRGRLTDTMQHSSKLTGTSNAIEVKRNVPVEDSTSKTELLETNKAEITSGQQTDLLDASEATELLTSEDTTVSLNEETKSPAKRMNSKKLTMLDEVILVHTDEVIN